MWQTAVRVFRRYLQFDPSQREKYIDFLLQVGFGSCLFVRNMFSAAPYDRPIAICNSIPQANKRHINEAAQQLAIVVNDPDFVSKKVRVGIPSWPFPCVDLNAHQIFHAWRVITTPRHLTTRGNQSTNCGWNCAISFRSTRKRLVQLHRASACP